MRPLPAAVMPVFAARLAIIPCARFVEQVAAGPGAMSRSFFIRGYPSESSGSLLRGCGVQSWTLSDDCLKSPLANSSFALRIETAAGSFCLFAPTQFQDRLRWNRQSPPHEPPTTLQRFHWWIHSKSKLDWPIDVSSQIIFAALVIGAASALR
jgi:hypothetical protein